MSLVDVIQDAALELGFRNITTVVGSNDLLTKQLLALANETVAALVDEHLWPQLRREYTFTTVDGQANYALPGDFDRQVFETHWDRSNNWELVGPISPDEWQRYKSGILTTTPRRIFQLKGVADRQFYIHPTPSASTDNETLVFEYISTQAIRPKVWATSLTFASGSYCFYDGNIYYAATGGTTGATPPTHITGSVNDGGISWAYFDDPYLEFLADTDTCLLGDRIVKLGVKWRFRKAKRFEWEPEFQEYMQALNNLRSKLSGARAIRLGDSRGYQMLGRANIPESGFGS